VSTATRPTRTEVLARLAGARKSDRGAAAYSRWVNRRLGRHIAASAHLAGLTPNQVSVISAIFTFPAIASLAIFRPGWIVAIAVPVALLIGYAFDSADGQVARLRGGGSPAGEWLDHVFDALKVSSFHVVIAIMWFRFYHLQHAATLLIPLAFVVVTSVFFFALMLSDMLRRIAGMKLGGSGVPTASVDPNEAAPALRSWLVLPNDYGLLCLCLILIPLHHAFIIVYTLLLAANTLFLLAGSVRWFREMTALGRG
jgi:phosphatidylglycerophosphate synthase